MIDSLKVRNYRSFSEFGLEQTGLVNLIVGTNNSGKSSLLEAIYLLNSEFPVESLLYILGERGEYNLYRTDVNHGGQSSTGYMILHIFNGHRFDAGSKIAFSSGANNDISLEFSVGERSAFK